jgi:hypothetical protein
VLWIKELPQAVGADVHAVRTAVSAFFTGLAVGSWFLRRRADRPARLLGLAGNEAPATRAYKSGAKNTQYSHSGLSNPFTSRSNSRLII